MAKRLLGTLAAADPDRLADLLGAAANAEEALEVLGGIPDGEQCEVLSRLDPEAAERLLNAISNDQLSLWLGSAPVDAGRRLLNRVDRVRGLALIAGVAERRKRRDLTRVSAYPSGTVGERTRLDGLTVTAETPAAAVERRIARQGERQSGPVIVLDERGEPIGVLDPAALLRRRDAGAVASELCIRIDAAPADATLAELRLPPAWAGLTVLPVADHRGQAVGYVTRADIEAARSDRPQADLFLESLIELAQQFWSILFYATNLLLTRRSGP